VITGSFNWSPSAAHQNDEVLLVIESPLLAAHFTREMDRLWRGAELGINGRLALKLAANRRRCGSGVRRRYPWQAGSSCEYASVTKTAIPVSRCQLLKDLPLEVLPPGRRRQRWRPVGLTGAEQCGGWLGERDQIGKALLLETIKKGNGSGGTMGHKHFLEGIFKQSDTR